MTATDRLDYDAIVIGAGFAGLYALKKLRDDLGLRVLVIEAGGGVGGTWFWNRYPGAKCDSESFVYCYSFSPELNQEWDWSGKYPSHDELRKYLEHVADRFGLLKDIHLNRRVLGASFEGAAWNVRTDDGATLTSRYLITGVGLLASAQHTPKFSGLEDFEGEVLHTGSWPAEGVSFAGKRVGIIGTGSSGVQAIPEIAKTADELYVFQRTAQFAIPAQHHTVDEKFLAEVKANYPEIWKKTQNSAGGFPWTHNGRSVHEDTPEQRREVFESLWKLGGVQFVFKSYYDIGSDRQANEYVAEFIRGKIRSRVNDPKVADLLTPVDHPFAAKRPIVETDYFETYNQDNVHLVDVRHFPITGLNAKGLETTREQYDLDMLIFATGFDAVSGPFLRMDLTGRDGVKLSEQWTEADPVSYLGLTVPNFPNLFTITGPGSTFTNAPVTIEHHVNWIADCIAFMHSHNYVTVEPTEDATHEWASIINRVSDKSLMRLASSWLLGSNIPGKKSSVLFYFGSYAKYRKTLDEVRTAKFESLQFAG